jgi:hypothetical protein
MCGCCCGWWWDSLAVEAAVSVKGGGQFDAMDVTAAPWRIPLLEWDTV